MLPGPCSLRLRASRESGKGKPKGLKPDCNGSVMAEAMPLQSKSKIKAESNSKQRQIQSRIKFKTKSN
jgi:hypothetical protein